MDGRATEGRDAEVGAAERRLAEALRAQASLGGARSTAPPAPSRPARPAAAPARTTPPAGQPRSGPPPGARDSLPGRAAQSGGQRVRDRADSQPTGKVSSVDPAAPTTQQPVHPTPVAKPPAVPRREGATTRPGARTPAPVGAAVALPKPGGAKPAGPGPRPGAPRGANTGPRPVVSPAPGPAIPDPSGGLAVRLRWTLLAGLVAGLLLGCLLAGLSVLDTGLFPALG